MGTQASFQEILEEKLQKGPAFDSAEGYKNPSFLDQDPAHLAYLLGSLGRHSFRPTAAKIYPAPPKPPPRAHTLTAEQQTSYQFFGYYGVDLSPSFTRLELKKAFRALALRLHPDMNKGACGPFIELQNHLQILNAFFS